MNSAAPSVSPLPPSVNSASFWWPDYLEPSAWLEHAPFAFWLTGALRPGSIVELGTHRGFSYFAFCQAVRKLGLGTRCHAVDSWRGDQHAGYYDEDVYESVRTYNEAHYAAFSRLVRSTFDDALPEFADGSIDLLHIDGRHFYEDVKHDFESWRPKLSDRAVVLFHDTSVRERNFGVFRLWDEVTAEHPGFAFTHGFGLGVLGYGSALPAEMRSFFATTADPAAATEVSTVYGRLGAALKAESDLRRAAASLGARGRNIEARATELMENLRRQEARATELAAKLEARARELQSLRGPAAALVSHKGRRARSIGGGLRNALSGVSGGLKSLERGFRAVLKPARKRAAKKATGGQSRPTVEKIGYPEWIVRNDTLSDVDRFLIRSHISAFRDRPKISILMRLHNGSADHVRQAVDTVRRQLYEDWELWVVGAASGAPALRAILEDYARTDARIRLVPEGANGAGAAALDNLALERATGDWIVLMGQEDMLSEHALYLVAEAINADPGAAIVYSDEDRIDADGARSDPYFKPDWDYELFLGQNLLSHLCAYRTDLARQAGGFREGFEAARDWDLALRMVGAINAPGVHHVPFVLYHRRAADAGLTTRPLAPAREAARWAVNEHFARTGQDAEAVPIGHSTNLRIKRRLPVEKPLVSIVIPTRNKCELLRTCVDGLVNRTDYEPIEIVVVDNGSDEAEALAYLDEIRQLPNAKVVPDGQPFNFSRLVNRGVAASSGDVCLLLNNDIDVIHPGWLAEMVSHVLRPDVGAVGAKLYYANDTVQHGGVILGLGVMGVAGHEYKQAPRQAPGYFNRLNMTHESSCVTGACMAVRRAVYDGLGGFNERDLEIGLNDVDFCIRLRLAGYRIIWTPRAELYHYESISRGKPGATGEGAARASAENAYMRRQWGPILDNDPYYNPNFSLDAHPFHLGVASRVRKPWLDFAAARSKRHPGAVSSEGLSGLRWFRGGGPTGKLDLAEDGNGDGAQPPKSGPRADGGP